LTPLGFLHPLLQPEARSVHVQNVGMMRQPVNQGGSQHGVREEFLPAGEFKIRGDYVEYKNFLI